MPKILVVEDDKFLSEAYRSKLTTADFEVRVATDGEGALKELAGFSPDVIVLDLKMPKSDGFYFLEALRQNGQINKVPIIVASNSGDKIDIERAMALGATDYVVKSNLSMKGLIEKIGMHLKPQAPTLS